MAIMMIMSIKVFQDHFCTAGDWTRINDSKTFSHLGFTFFYEPDGIGNMTKVMIMIILIIIMIMLIFLQAKVFQVALKVGLLLVDLTHFTQI